MHDAHPCCLTVEAAELPAERDAQCRHNRGLPGPVGPTASYNVTSEGAQTNSTSVARASDASRPAWLPQAMNAGPSSDLVHHS